MNKAQLPAIPGLPRLFATASLLAMVLFSATLRAQEPPSAEPAPEKPVAASARPIISTGIEAEAIARSHPDSAVWLAIGNQDQALALFHPEQASPAKGALVVLADEGMSAASGIADALQEPLGRAGWAVMTLGLPSPPFAVQEWLRQQNNARPGSADKQEEPSSVMINVMDAVTPEKELAQYRDRVEASLSAAVEALEAREYQRIVLVGIGRAAGHITRQAGEDARVSDLVWIGPQFYTDESDELTELLAASTSPSVLELYGTFPGEEGLDRAAREREAAMERAGIEGYDQQPVAMAPRPQAREAHKLSNRISAWLNSTAR